MSRGQGQALSEGLSAYCHPLKALEEGSHFTFVVWLIPRRYEQICSPQIEYWGKTKVIRVCLDEPMCSLGSHPEAGVTEQPRHRKGPPQH